MAGRFCAVARDGPVQNVTGQGQGTGTPAGSSSGWHWLPRDPAQCINPAPVLLQSTPCPLQDVQVNQVPPGQETAPSLLPGDLSVPGCGAQALSWVHQPGGDGKNPKEQQVVGRNHSALRNILHGTVGWFGLEETLKMISFTPRSQRDRGTSHAEWELLLSFQPAQGRSCQAAPPRETKERQQEGNLEQCKAGAAAPICDSQEPEQTLGDVRDDDQLKNCRNPELLQVLLRAHGSRRSVPRCRITAVKWREARARLSWKKRLSDLNQLWIYSQC